MSAEHLTPDRLTMEVEGLSAEATEYMATQAHYVAVRSMPKLTGDAALTVEPIWGTGMFGLYWSSPYLWFQEAGINPFTMKNLAGKTIPMWVNDPSGGVASENPNAKTRITADGRSQTLIFRKAAPMGSTKTVKREGRNVEVPRSYPGAPGRIAPTPRGGTNPGSRGGGRDERGRILAGNVGVRWRHPGLMKRGFIRNALTLVAQHHGVRVGVVRDQFGRFR